MNVTGVQTCALPISIRYSLSAGGRAAPALPPLDLLDLERLGAARRDDLDLGALGLADQRAGERGGDGDAAGLGVGLGLADDLPDPLLVGVLVDQRDGGAEFHGVA